MIYYLLRPSKARVKGKLRSGVMVVAAERIGQRYVDMGGKIFRPEYIYTLDDIVWKPTLRAAEAFIRKQGDDVQVCEFYGLRHTTSISSGGGPGWYALDEKGGPLFAAVGDKESVPPEQGSLFPPVRS